MTATMAIDSPSLDAEIMCTGILSIRGFSIFTESAPPMAEARVTDSVTPIWMVARNLAGFSLKPLKSRAVLLPWSMSCLMRLRLEVTTAISAAAKKPFRMIKKKIRKISNHIRSITLRLPLKHPSFVRLGPPQAEKGVGISYEYHMV